MATPNMTTPPEGGAVVPSILGSVGYYFLSLTVPGSILPVTWSLPGAACLPLSSSFCEPSWFGFLFWSVLLSLLFIVLLREPRGCGFHIARPPYRRGL